MRAVVLRKPGGPEELRLEEIPDPVPGPEEVLVRVRAVAVCGRDLIDRRGGYAAMKLPVVLGHEMAGEVVSAGDAARASGLRPGDRVVNLHRASCGACRRCRDGEANHCERTWEAFGYTVDGGYAELFAAHPRALVELPPAIPFDVGSTLMCTAGVALHALRNRGGLRLGQTVLITGASGGVGAVAVQIARRMGARVVAVTGSEGKAAVLRELGAHTVVVSPDGRFHEEVRRVTEGGADLALELTGNPTFLSALRSLRQGGRLVVLGNIDATKVGLSLGALIVNGTSILGTSSCGPEEMEDVFRLIEVGDLSPRIDRVLPLDQAAEAHRLLAARAVVGRVVLAP
jgi:acryloyl-coenzyme A reductase